MGQRGGDKDASRNGERREEREAIIEAKGDAEQAANEISAKDPGVELCCGEISLSCRIDIDDERTGHREQPGCNSVGQRRKRQRTR